METATQKRMTRLRRIVYAAIIAVILSVLCSCGSDSSPQYFYSITVINNTDSTLTVRYDWDVIILVPEWTQEDTIPPRDSGIIEWSSETAPGDQIEIEYQGARKIYIVPQLDTVTVTAQDFQN